MKSAVLSRYWLFQLLGWGAFILINIFFAGIFDMLNEKMICRLLFFVETGFFFSHLMRESIHRSAILSKTLQKQIINFIILTIVYSVLIALVQTPFEMIYDLRPWENAEKETFHRVFFANFASAASSLFMWNCIYFLYHYVMKSRKQQMDTLRLEALVKALELKTIKAHINPHFIFNALNSIRALIDENPQRARAAVTELSNILRSSLMAEKGETVSFKEELKIVKDYLALENMRFEDRLQVQYEVDEKTLSRLVPPMMLQSLVENAIKHGISKQVKGGLVKITSGLKDHFHELSVQNTGRLNGNGNTGGFGLSSTKDRLKLLYGDKARFEIKQLNEQLVEAKVLIP